MVSIGEKKPHNKFQKPNSNSFLDQRSIEPVWYHMVVSALESIFYTIDFEVDATVSV